MNKGEIWLVEFPKMNGHEQTGTRPVLILADTEANISIVVPFTTNVQALRFPHTITIKPSTHNGLKSESVALVFHVRAIDKKRLKNKIGMIEDSIMKSIDMSLKDMLKI